MRAIVVREPGGPEVLKLEDVPEPAAGDGLIPVRLEVAAVNHFDINARRTPETVGMTLPFTPGIDGAGTRIDTGERVLVSGYPGTYAEVIAAPDEAIRPIPDPLGWVPAAALGVAYKTAWASLMDADLKEGETLLVQAGSSGTGQAAIDIGHRRERVRDLQPGEARSPARPRRRAARLRR
jgi:NADPH2:quinone reductase